MSPVSASMFPGPSFLCVSPLCLTRALVTGFGSVRVIQGGLISKPLSELHLQGWFCHIRSHWQDLGDKSLWGPSSSTQQAFKHRCFCREQAQLPNCSHNFHHCQPTTTSPQEPQGDPSKAQATSWDFSAGNHHWLPISPTVKCKALTWARKPKFVPRLLLAPLACFLFLAPSTPTPSYLSISSPLKLPQQFPQVMASLSFQLQLRTKERVWRRVGGKYIYVREYEWKDNIAHFPF